MYHETMQHFESKERLGKNCVLFHGVLQMVNWKHLWFIIKGCYGHLYAQNKQFIVNMTQHRKTH
jgi:hypothetical protein